MLCYHSIIFLIINKILVLVIHLLIMQEKAKSKSKLYHNARAFHPLLISFTRNREITEINRKNVIEELVSLP